MNHRKCKHFISHMLHYCLLNCFVVKRSAAVVAEVGGHTNVEYLQIFTVFYLIQSFSTSGSGPDCLEKIYIYTHFIL